MKTFILYPFLLILMIALISCKKDQAIAPGISIYKTTDDYFNFVDIGVKDGRIFRRSSFSNEKSKIVITNSDTIYKLRIKLIDDYVLDFEADERYDVFLDLTYKQHLLMEIKYGNATLSDDTLNAHIVNKNPYIEFYRDVQNPRRFGNTPEDIDTAVINQIIREGNIGQFLQQLK